MCFNKVVFPAPRKPDSKVTGSLDSRNLEKYLIESYPVELILKYEIFS